MAPPPLDVVISAYDATWALLVFQSKPEQRAFLAQLMGMFHADGVPPSRCHTLPSFNKVRENTEAQAPATVVEPAPQKPRRKELEPMCACGCPRSAHKGALRECACPTCDEFTPVT